MVKATVDGIKVMLRSRRIKMAVLALLVPIANKKLDLGMTPEEVWGVFGVVISVIFGFSWEDAKGTSKNPHPDTVVRHR